MKLLIHTLWPTMLLTSLLAMLLAVSSLAQSTPSVSSAMVASADEFYQKQDWANAVKAYQTVTAEYPNNGQAWYRLGIAHHALGQYQQAVEAMLKAEAIGHNPVVMFNLACAYARLNNKDKAFEWLSQAMQRGFRQAQTLENDDDLASLRADARYKPLVESVRANAEPCTKIPEARQFDFWLGEWDVKNTAGQMAGQSSIQLILGKCVILEHWTGTGGVSGKSFNVFDTTDHKWHQTWVDDQGTFTEYKNGEYKDGKLVYVAEQMQKGQKTLQRMTFFNLDANRVRQFGETSNDGGQTWQVSYDLIYHRKNPAKGGQ
ncbi:MAG: tetratricopeptide repeat protein [Acidobacteria bacterium]|nr:tetratricopeptide repeat protein [Acidobacteriota bacterium]MBI3425180.1 tetratricopeptide repeat protein [Acidobacteriota bacterium]